MRIYVPTFTYNKWEIRLNSAIEVTINGLVSQSETGSRVDIELNYLLKLLIVVVVLFGFFSWLWTSRIGGSSTIGSLSFFLSFLFK